MPLGDISVRPDWQAIERQEQVDRAKRSNLLQFGLIGYGLAALGFAAWHEAPPWLALVQALFFAGAFVWMPLQASIYGKAGKRKTLLVAAIALLGITPVAILTAPAVLHPDWSLIPQLPAWLSVVIPAAMAAFLVWATHRHAGLSHALGFSARYWGYQTIMGLSMGIALGLHMWIMVGSLPQGSEPRLAPWPVMVWLLSTVGGFQALGAELTLRGALLRLLATEPRGLRVGVFVRIAVLSMPLYIAPLLQSMKPSHTAPAVVYGFAFTLLALVLRISQRSIVAPLAANAGFGLFLALVNLA